jgi:hypothetical protein
MAQIRHCEYCGRSNYLSGDEACKGCGAPLSSPEQWLFRPGQNISIDLSDLPENSKIADSWVSYYEECLRAAFSNAKVF